MAKVRSAKSVVRFWERAGPKRWFRVDRAFDDRFRRRFMATHLAAARRELEGWLETPAGALALLILLDQFPRNAWRGTGHAFATDGLARLYAGIAVERGDDLATGQSLRRFFYMPYQHSEDLADQERSLRLFAALPREPNDRWAEHHHGLVARFGRFPHRNAALGRADTPDEEAFLAEHGSGQ